MILIDNKNVRLINFSGVMIGPRINKLTDSQYEYIEKVHKGQLEAMAKRGEIEIIKQGKITIDLIENTLDKELLEEWETKATGKHKKAIQKQLELLEMPKEEDK